MEHGHFQPNGKTNAFYLSTGAFTLEEVRLLCSVLYEKFGLETTIHNLNGKHNIPARSFAAFRAIVRPYFHYSMLYQLE
jgi:hypothetical protein